MTLGRLQKLLSVLDENRTVTYGFTHAHSWRGIYAEAAFEPAMNVPVKEMRAEVERALSETFTGWKGGDYSYDKWTEAHLDYIGEYNQMNWAAVVLSIVDAIEAD